MKIKILHSWVAEFLEWGKHVYFMVSPYAGADWTVFWKMMHEHKIAQMTQLIYI